MNNFKRLTALTLAVTIIGASAYAQNSTENTTKNDNKTEEIIIRKKGDKADKMTIVVEGDKVTINGKPVDEFKNEDVTVIRRNGMNNNSPRVRAYTSPRSFLQMPEDGAPFPPMPGGNKAMLGVMTANDKDGAKVTDVTKESAAQKAGLQKDDIITKVDNKKVENAQDLIEAIGDHKPNDKVDITYKRNGKENQTAATLGENKARAYAFNFNNGDFNRDFNRDFNFRAPSAPEVPGFNLNFNRKPRIGLQIQDVEEGKGVTVKDVDDESPAAKAGIKEGDVITQVDGKDVAGVDDMRSQIKDLKEGDTVRFTYKRGNKTQNAEVKLPKRLKTADL